MPFLRCSVCQITTPIGNSREEWFGADGRPLEHKCCGVRQQWLGEIVKIAIPTDTTIVCKKCRYSHTVPFGTIYRENCPQCGADRDGKVHPKKRETPRDISIALDDNAELDGAIRQSLDEQIVADYRAGKKQAVGKMIGQLLKKFPDATGNEIRARIERVLA